MNRLVFAEMTALFVAGAMIHTTWAAEDAADQVVASADPDLMGWWKLDDEGSDTASDSSGWERHGILYGDPLWTPGFLGGAIQFDGVDDFIETGYTENLSQWTVCTWVRSPLPPTAEPASGPMNREANYQLNWNHPNVRFRGAAAFRVGSDWYLASFGPLSADTWLHLTATLDDTALRTYVNGVLITINSTARGPASHEPRTLTLGRHCAAPQFFMGQIDDVRIYNRALSLAEIAGVMERHPLLAWNPSPAVDAVVSLEKVNDLSWSAGEKAVAHDVYLGTDAAVVESADMDSAVYWGRVEETSFPLAGVVESVGRYFWRIDEVEADGVTIHKGLVWSFGVGGSVVIDDFESYMEQEGGRIRDVWMDGTVNNTGALVGSHIERVGTPRLGYSLNQRMTLTYNHGGSPSRSEVEREFTPAQDWTASLAKTLNVLVKGEVVSFCENPPGVFTMTASGEDIWSNHDEMRYAWRQLNGDGSVSVRIDGVDCTHEWAKCGVMIRESLDQDSAHAAMYITPSGRRAMQTRPTSDTGVCLTAHSHTGAVSTPIWIKLQRRGDEFTAYYSHDGQTWIRQPDDEAVTTYQTTNPTTIPMPTTVCVGLVLSSHDEQHVGTAVFSDVKTSGYVNAQWRVADIGFDHPGNGTDDLYVALEDSDGATAIVVNPDPTAVNATAWTQWSVSLSDFAGVDLTEVKKIRIGVGGSDAAIAPVAGKILLDDLTLTAQ